MSGWRRCDRCRKVRTTEEFDGDATTCTVCLTAPVPTAARKRTTTVTRSQTAPRPPAAAPAEPAVRRPLLGSVGSGDLEVRERRARRAASEALAQSHPEEFALLLRDARAAEGLRPLSNGAPTSPDGAAPADAAPPADGD
jgi:hypothetical protein